MISEVPAPPSVAVAPLRVHLGERSYDIHMGEGSLDRLGPLAAEVVPGRRTVLLSHPRLMEAHGGRAKASLEAAGFRVTPILIPPGERQKSLNRLADLIRRMLTSGLDRRSALVALGGGVLGDLGGLTAALYMRGIPYIQVPTTLLAMVDSSVGGKTAVDFEDAKNAVGVFHQPRLVVIDLSTLATLPIRETRAGLAEVLKYGVLGDAAFFAWVRDHAADLLALDAGAVSYAVRRSCAMKAEVVEADEFDRTGCRAALNLGHTVGHALEALGGYRLYRHGEAVAVGMVSAALLAERLGVAEEPVSAPILAALTALGLPTRPKVTVTPQALLSAMLKDKKTTDGTLHFVLPKRIGEVMTFPVPADAVTAALAEQGKP